MQTFQREVPNMLFTALMLVTALTSLVFYFLLQMTLDYVS